MKRVHPVTKEVFVPHRYGDGTFRLADPRLGRERHHLRNAVCVRTETEAMALVRQGYALRMRGLDTGSINLIASSQIEK